MAATGEVTRLGSERPTERTPYQATAVRLQDTQQPIQSAPPTQATRALLGAINFGNFEEVDRAIDHGADVNFVGEIVAQTPLMLAARARQAEQTPAATTQPRNTTTHVVTPPQTANDTVVQDAQQQIRALFAVGVLPPHEVGHNLGLTRTVAKNPSGTSSATK
ncbi:MAG: hypothetical protein WCK49_03250 [Myxococcaceae bacterium]